MARRSGFRQASRARKTRDWGNGPGGSTVTTLTASGKAILGSGIGPTNEQEITLARTRGILELVMTSGAAGDGWIGAMGIGKTTQQAFTVGGVTSLPGPITEVDWDGWLYHQFFSLHGPAAFASNGTGPFTRNIEVDSKAMRKLGGAELLFAIIEVTEEGASALEVWFDSRMLFLLS